MNSPERAAVRGIEVPRRPFLVRRLNLRQMLQQGVDEPPAGVAAALAERPWPKGRLLGFAPLRGGIGTKRKPRRRSGAWAVCRTPTSPRRPQRRIRAGSSEDPR